MNFWNFANMWYCVAITCRNYNFLNYKNSSFDLSHLYIHKHKRARTHTQTHACTHTHTHACTSKITFINENIRFYKDSAQIERYKRKYLHYLDKMIENARWRSSFSVKFFQRFCLDFKWLHSSLVYSDLLLQIILIRKQQLEILVKSWKISYEEFHSYI